MLLSPDSSHSKAVSKWDRKTGRQSRNMEVLSSINRGKWVCSHHKGGNFISVMHLLTCAECLRGGLRDSADLLLLLVLKWLWCAFNSYNESRIKFVWSFSFNSHALYIESIIYKSQKLIHRKLFKGLTNGPPLILATSSRWINNKWLSWVTWMTEVYNVVFYKNALTSNESPPPSKCCQHILN